MLDGSLIGLSLSRPGTPILEVAIVALLEGLQLQIMVYCSRATVPTSSLLVISDILAVSQRNNARDNLTGALAICDDLFLQVIEGPSSAIDGLLRRLNVDSRHRNIEILIREPAQIRLFCTWSMASSRITPELGPELVRLIQECQDEPKMAVAALRKIISEQSV